MLVVGLFFIWQLIYFSAFDYSEAKLTTDTNQVQGFESEFSIQSYPDEFLPSWFANEIRSTSSRIYQANGLGKNGSKALAVQPISTFNGELIIRLSPKNINGPKVRFWARSVKNGSGDRPALVSYRWSMQIDGTYSIGETLGGANEFANENQEFRLFELELPEEYNDVEEIFLMIEIRYGPGSGSCAKWLMDDFEFGEFMEDNNAPKVTRIRGFDESQLEVQFDEALDPVFSGFLLNYKLGELEPIEVNLLGDSLVYLTFEERLKKGEIYDLKISQIPDLAGNFLRDTLISFQFFDPSFIPAKTLVINELMPAPKADLDLPNVEYIEIFHAGEYAVRLGGVTWSNSRSTVSLPDEWIQPGEFLLLAPVNQASLLENYGEVIPIISWPTLLNSADHLSLKDDEGYLIDKISYSTSSWGGGEFANGGYSLEVTNPFYACEQSDLLRASTDPLRGTPGRQNSVFDLSPDSTLTNLDLFEFTSSRSLLLTFSKPILSGFDQVNFVFEPSLQVDTITQPSSKQVQILFSEDVPFNTIYSLRIESLLDCSGNEYVQSIPLKLVLPLKAEVGDVLINELLSNPRSGSPKFVELINVSDNYLEVGGWKLANFDDKGEVDQVKQLSESSVIIPPGSFLAITSNPDLLMLDYPKSAFGEFLKIASLPSYPIAGGTVVLIDYAGSIADSFSYSEDLHHPLLRDPKGVSLERLSIESPASLSANWHSASAVEEYATPGRMNSQVISGEFEG